MPDIRPDLGFTTTQYAEWVAVHEAGHTVAALAMGLKVRSVEIHRDHTGLTKGGIMKSSRSTRDTRILPAFHAGIEAQALWLQQTRLWSPWRMELVRASARHDLNVIDQFTPTPDARQTDADTARRHLTTHWSLVQRITDALLDRGRLTARDLRRLL